MASDTESEALKAGKARTMAGLAGAMPATSPFKPGDARKTVDAARAARAKVEAAEAELAEQRAAAERQEAAEGRALPEDTPKLADPAAVAAHDAAVAQRAELAERQEAARATAAKVRAMPPMEAAAALGEAVGAALAARQDDADDEEGAANEPEPEPEGDEQAEPEGEKLTYAQLGEMVTEFLLEKAASYHHARMALSHCERRLGNNWTRNLQLKKAARRAAGRERTE